MKREIWSSWSEVAAQEVASFFRLNRSEENGAIVADRIAPEWLSHASQFVREKIGGAAVWADVAHDGAWFVRVGPEDWETCRDGGSI